MNLRNALNYHDAPISRITIVPEQSGTASPRRDAYVSVYLTEKCVDMCFPGKESLVMLQEALQEISDTTSETAILMLHRFGVPDVYRVAIFKEHVADLISHIQRKLEN